VSEKKGPPIAHLVLDAEGRRLLASKRFRINVNEGDDRESLRRAVVDAISRAEVVIGAEVKKEMDPHRIADSANGFFLASQRAFEPRPLPREASQVLLVPGVVCLAFAGELYLKSIITLEGGHANVHGLTDLFERVSSRVKEEVRGRLSLSEEDMKLKLADASDAFITWRYVYEEESPEINLKFMRGLIDALRAIAEGLLASAPKAVRPVPTEEDILRFVASWQKKKT
jgi:HEPN domain-containing protein